MSPEAGIALVVTLLWGPTALWLLYRAVRGHQRPHSFGPFASPSESTSRDHRPPAELEALVEADGLWACGACRSLNRREASRCYSCRSAKGIADRQASTERPVSPGVPVMAESVARSSGDLPVSPGVPVMAESVARSSGDLPVSPGVPVMAESVARSSGGAAGATATDDIPRNAPTPAGPEFRPEPRNGRRSGRGRSRARVSVSRASG